MALDTVCQYWPWLSRVDADLHSKHKPLLSVMHAKAHNWNCQVWTICTVCTSWSLQNYIYQKSGLIQSRLTSEILSLLSILLACLVELNLLEWVIMLSPSMLSWFNLIYWKLFVILLDKVVRKEPRRCRREHRGKPLNRLIVSWVDSDW